MADIRALKKVTESLEIFDDLKQLVFLCFNINISMTP
jgi:hypothetical protein